MVPLAYAVTRGAWPAQLAVGVLEIRLVDDKVEVEVTGTRYGETDVVEEMEVVALHGRVDAMRLVEVEEVVEAVDVQGVFDVNAGWTMGDVVSYGATAGGAPCGACELGERVEKEDGIGAT